jgi:hypothetical protein
MLSETSSMPAQQKWQYDMPFWGIEISVYTFEDEDNNSLTVNQE